MLIASWIFGVSFAACLYVYAGYPALLLLLARLRPRPVRRASVQPTLSVVIPAFNEQDVIREKIEATFANGYPVERLEVIVASDGSTDDTNEIVRRLEGERVRLLALPRSGKVAALNAAASVARGEILVFTDADVSLDPGALSRLVSNFADPAVGGVTGRKAQGADAGGGAIGRGEGLYTRFDEWQKRLESLIGSTISAHGALHGIRRELYRPVADGSGADDMAISMRVVLQERRLVYEPDAVARVETPAGARAEFRRKVRVANQAMRALAGIGPALWTSGFYSLELISHKLLRYVVPVFLMAMLVTNALLALDGRTAWQLMLRLQLAFYGAAALGLLLDGRGRSRFRRLLTVPCYFCTVNAAALVALLSLIVGRRAGTWTPGGGFHGAGATARARYAVTPLSVEKVS
ncbi:MAG TPA: glycosyltransferase [Gemmatimonadaceae bacterium]|nr:glycosyltransferase [Gemmatimonadaceae bacterium]